MNQLKRLVLITATIICCLIKVQGIDEYTDAKRPYEFGFSIDGEQHRHEKKDKNGIIMGEFGFITADDVYHVTVYATDENGRFKILSMKNIHLKSTPTSRQGHSLQLPTAAQMPAVSKTTSPQISSALAPIRPIQKPQQDFKPVSVEPPANSCSHCSLPSTSTQAPKLAVLQNNQANLNSNYNNPNLLSSPAVGGIQYPQGASAPSNYPGQQSSIGVPQGFGSPSPSQQNVPFGSTNSGQPLAFGQKNAFNSVPNYPQQTPIAPQNRQQFSLTPSNAQQTPVNSQSYPGQQNVAKAPQNPSLASDASPAANISPYNPQSVNGPKYAVQNGGFSKGAQGPQQYPQSNFQSQQGPTSSSGSQGPTNLAGQRTAKQFIGAQGPPARQQNIPQIGVNSVGRSQGAPVTNKPTLVTAQMQIVDKNTDIHYKRPGEKEGLPEGLTEHDMMHLLYTFNYTLGFQAHYEEGYTNGFKQGYYFVTGRNGVRTRIDYTADDTGFHPKVSQEVLGLLSDDVPKPETEKDEKYGLRGYEFKWLYYPVDHKSR